MNIVSIWVFIWNTGSGTNLALLILEKNSVWSGVCFKCKLYSFQVVKHFHQSLT